MRLLTLMSLLAATACSEAPPSLPRLPPDGIVLSFGNSLTFGTGARPDQSYPAVLEELIGRRVVRSGVPGELSQAGLARLPRELDRHRPALLILCHGGNDMLRKLPMENLRGNLAAMIELALQREIPVVLLGVPRPAIFGLDSAAVYAELATHYELPYEPDALPGILADSALKSDLAHPNAAGYAVLAKAVAELLREAGAIVVLNE